MTTLFSMLDAWRPVRALVVGDYMLDQFVYGDAERLSPDAPVPVLSVRRTEDRPGGAANVCLDLVAMRAEVRAVGVVGRDEEGKRLRSALEEAGVGCAGLIADPARPTTLKRSLVGLAQHRHPQKMFRMDVESRAALDAERRADVLRACEDALAWAEVVLIEDYNKGVCATDFCAALIAMCNARGTPVLVDPASLEEYSRYAGATCVTPNRTEAELAAGVRAETREDTPDSAEGVARTWAALGTRLLEKHDLQTVVLTLDRHGALLLERGKEPVHLPTVARQVYDVTGAGDMVLAALGAAIGNGASWEDAVRFANAAAGLEVEVFGVQPIPFERIHHALLRDHGRLAGKTRTLEEALIEVSAHRREGRSVVFTNGCFDLLHAGHVALLRHAAKQGDVLIVGVNDDGSTRRLKGEGRPVHAERDRAEILGELESVDMVVLFAEDTPLRLIEAIKPDVLVKGGDYTPEQVVGHEAVLAHGGRIEIAPLLDGRSTTSAVRKIRAATGAS
ncbi:MAG: D-glycero-beta-D-manno-heptose 1-phosphate adenylyltransferase [Phycisphaerales bacterium]|nr:MAG: D-glycero-beta-D-manno-heptose 1-phosphate adenylyltransferase [Phycisphaerales bacterium]